MMQFELFEEKDNFPTIWKHVNRSGSDYATQLAAFQQVANSNNKFQQQYRENLRFFGS